MATHYSSAVHNLGEEKWYSTADGVDPWSITRLDVTAPESGGEASWALASPEAWSAPSSVIKSTKLPPVYHVPSTPISPPKSAPVAPFADESSPPSSNNLFFYQIPSGQRQHSWDQYVVSSEMNTTNKAMLPQKRFGSDSAPSSPTQAAQSQQSVQVGWPVSPTKSPVSPVKRSHSVQPAPSVAKQLQFSPTKSPEKQPAPIHHAEQEVEGGHQSLYKTELCRSWAETGACRYGNKCQFAHGVEELRPVARHPKYKTEICRTFHTLGTCPYGTRCRFIHNRDGVLPPDWSSEMQRARSYSQPLLAQQQQQQQQQQACQPVSPQQTHLHKATFGLSELGGEPSFNPLASQMESLSMWDHPTGPAPVPAAVAVSSDKSSPPRELDAPSLEAVDAVDATESEPEAQPESGSDKKKGSRLPFFQRLTNSLRGKSKEENSPISNMKDKRSKSLAQ